MIEYFVTNAEMKLEKIDGIVRGCWINIVSPTEEEIILIGKQLNIPIDFLKDPLDDEERSRIEKEDDKALIIADFPFMTHDDVGFPIYDTIPMGMIITNDHFITISLRETPILDDFKNNRIRGFYTNKKTRFALQILFSISSYYLKYLKQINKKTNEIERELHQSMKNKELYSFLALEKSLVYFTTSLKSNKVVLDKMLRLNHLKMYEEDKDLLDDVIIENTQAIEMADTYSSILSGMMDAFASVISNNLNIVMKFLTSITLILSFPTMVASIYGMNIDLPFQNSPYAFFITMGMAVFLSSLTTVIFWKKKFF
ncbi:magnesium transporter CorA family protein [Metabacillus fastidiosus]|uniref:Magnesium transporter CorA family protein n=1 Tax=Metabacillus fastidiosus TaxID=1458 RepID=A0ABU6NTE0_9BACI|nr:magnesium transporter CorA family protein [Metabacillus fastidiosus]MED4400416.1 magnesium transporter CorA family protein [Metabacillus fastidiosus]MED4454133.1 magnesium transporter CorA family protein [Metabacillus fastidiosus]MED4464300.1 magnesium transporter CorA family protein [Metabacillus fastidiosus]